MLPMSGLLPLVNLVAQCFCVVSQYTVAAYSMCSWKSPKLFRAQT